MIDRCLDIGSDLLDARKSARGLLASSAHPASAETQLEPLRSWIVRPSTLGSLACLPTPGREAARLLLVERAEER